MLRDEVIQELIIELTLLKILEGWDQKKLFDIYKILNIPITLVNEVLSNITMDYESNDEDIIIESHPALN